MLSTIDLAKCLPVPYKVVSRDYADFPGMEGCLSVFQFGCQITTVWLNMARLDTKKRYRCDPDQQTGSHMCCLWSVET